MYQEKLPPHDVDAEEAVLGSLIIDSEAIFKVTTLLRAEEFFQESNRWIYEASLSLYERSEAVNQITLAQELARRGRLDGIGGAAHLSHLVSVVPTSVYVEHYAQIVHRLAVMRQLIGAAGQIAAIGYEAGPDTEDALNRAENALFRIRYGRSRQDFVHIREVLGHYFEEGAPSLTEEGGHPQVFTGFQVLDELLGGMHRSDMIVLAARPSMGKTSLALSIARNAAVDGATVAIFSLEMARDALVERLLASEAGVDTKRVRLGLYTRQEEERIFDASGKLAEVPIYIDDSPTLRVMEMRSRARRLYNERGIDLIIVDYMQLMQMDGRSENRVQEMSEISRSLKALARELDVPVIAVSQLSREAERRVSHVPQLSDLRDSGSIEQDADIVLFIYRDEVYYSEEEWGKRYPDKPYPRGIADIIVGKHRNGPIGWVNLAFWEKTVRFANLEVRQSE